MRVRLLRSVLFKVIAAGFFAAAFYKFRKIPITVPIFIAITALCRLIILQGKGINTVDLLYESGAILLLALSALAIRWNLINLVRPKSEADRETE